MQIFQIVTILSVVVVLSCDAITTSDLYNINAQGTVNLQRGDEESRLINLKTPIHFYTEKYNSIYVS